MVASYRHMQQYMKVCRSLKLAEKSYSHFKMHKIKKKRNKKHQGPLDLKTSALTTAPNGQLTNCI